MNHKYYAHVTLQHRYTFYAKHCKKEHVFIAPWQLPHPICIFTTRLALQMNLPITWLKSFRVLHGSIAHPNHATAIAIKAQHAHFLTAHTHGSDQQNEQGNLVCYLHDSRTLQQLSMSLSGGEIYTIQEQPFQLATNTQDWVKKKLKCSNQCVKIQHHIWGTHSVSFISLCGVGGRDTTLWAH